MTQSNKPPIVFWIIAGIALLWNIMGLLAFAADFMITPEMIAEMEEPSKSLYENAPGWLKIPYAGATIGGLLGAIFLLLRNKLSLVFFLISFICVLIQMGFSIINASSIEGLPASQKFVMPLLVIGIAAFLVYYARKSKALGWVKS